MVLKQLKQSWTTLWNNKLWTLLAVFIDAGFFIGFAKVYTGIFRKASTFMNSVNAVLTSELPKLQTATNPNDILLSNAEFASAFNSILLYMVLMLATLYVFWTVFQGVNWWIAKNMINKTSFLQYMRSFALINISWLGVFLVIAVITGSLLAKSASTVIPLFGQSEVKVVSGILGLLLLYFMFISYSLLPKKKSWRNSFRVGWINYKVTLPWYFVTLVILFLLNFFLLRSYQYIANPAFTFAYIFIIFLPILTWVRVYTVRSLS